MWDRATMIQRSSLSLLGTLIVWARGMSSLSCGPADDTNDCLALQAFFASTGSVLPWPGSEADSNSSYCTWDGVSCNAVGRVATLDAHNLQLKGSLPDELGLLEEAEKLYLWANELGGTLPTLPPLLTDLMISANLLTGSLPENICSLNRLADFDFSLNKITGTVPPCVGSLTSLRTLKGDYNQLQGPLPPSLGGLGSLAYLILSYNQLTGTLPPELGAAGALFDVELHNNYFNGLVPAEFAALGNCTSLSLGFNLLRGLVPSELGTMPSLVGLFLENNGLTGPVPSQLGALAPTLRQLELDHNSLAGALPPELGALTGIETFHLASNALGGFPLPGGLGDNMTAVVSFDLSDQAPPPGVEKGDGAATGLVGPLPASVEALACRLLAGDNGASSQCLLGGNAFTGADCVASPCAAVECGACSSSRPAQ